MQSKSNNQVLIAHISDFHLPLTEPVPPQKLLGKRLLGYANLRLVRGASHRLAPCEQLLGHLASLKPDLIIATGDLVNLALDFEYENIAKVLERAGLRPENTLLLPGNHDRYTPASQHGCAFERGLAAWLPDAAQRRREYPVLRQVGSVTVLGLDTGIWRGPLRAAGRISPDQLGRLEGRLNEFPDKDGPLVVALHHPPFALQGSFMLHYRAGLMAYRRLLAVLGDRPATVLHGHLHRLIRRRIGNLDIMGVPSVSNDIGTPEAQLACHLLTFDSSGLVRAEAIRHWPSAREPAQRMTREDLPPAGTLG